MDNKKIIGAILGVVAFIALVAGATFAWLTATVNVTNGTYNNITSKNFLIGYNGGSDVLNPIMLDKSDSTPAKIVAGGSTTTAETSGTDAWVAVTASKTADDAAASLFKLTLNITTNTFATNSIVYAVCKEGSCPSNTSVLITAINTTSKTATCASGVASCGVIEGGSATAVDILSDTSTFNTEAAVSAKYNIFVWLDGPTIGEGDKGASFSGHISASATQQNNNTVKDNP